MILHAMASTKKSNAYKPLHCKETYLSENFFLKMPSVKLATVTSSIKGFHVYRRSPDIGEKLKCVLEETNRHSNTAIKVVGGTNETIGYMPDGLSTVVAPALKKPRDAAERKWTLGGGIEFPCIYRFYGPKKSKAEFLNKLSK